MTTALKPVRRRASALALSVTLLASGATATVAVSAGSASAQQQVAATRLEAHLKPSGDRNGSGEAKIRFSKAKRKVCADIEWHRIARPTAAHIHRRSDDGVVVDLTGSVTGGNRCTTGVSRKLIGKIVSHPGRYYVNVHNAPHPDGAIQGRLRH